MSRSVNRVTLLGHLGKDAETRFTQSGVACVTFSIATNRRWKDQSGQVKEETDWHNCVLWRGDKVAEYLQKGKQVYVDGRLQTRSYEAQDGSKRYVTEVIVGDLVLMGGGNGNRAPMPDAPPEGPDSRGITDDDVPF